MNPASQITSVLNFRDVGYTVNQYLGKKLVQEGMLYRSARQDYATMEDRERIRDELGIKGILDLRSQTEQDREEDRRIALSEQPAAVKLNPALAEPMRISGINYHNVKLTGSAFNKNLMRRLPFLSLIYFLILYVFGYRVQALHVLGSNAIKPMGLVGLNLSIMDISGRELATALGTYLQPDGLPSVVHCSLGKDRTGLVVSMVLMILGVPLSAVNHDYMLSEGALDSERQERIVELHAAGLTEDWVSPDKNMISRTRAHLDANHGGVESFLDSIGFTEADRCKLRELLLY